MNLTLNAGLSKNYHNISQQIRVMTEEWLINNIYCPNCGTFPLYSFQNNQPVADFFCPNCTEQFELKSKNTKNIGHTIADGAYHTMLERITSNTNPNFFFLNYQKKDFSIQNLIIIPKHFFTPDIIIPRNKGIPNRPHYIMCSIYTKNLPDHGKIKMIENGKIIPKHQVIEQWNQFTYLQNIDIEKRGWNLTILSCIEKIPNDEFTLKEIYTFIPELERQYPLNFHIKDKIRQQLQFLRDKGIIQFLARGHYRKIKR